MGQKTDWFRTARTLHGPREGGLVPFGWKGWLFTAICAALALGVWRLSVFSGAHHWTRVVFGSWALLGVIGFVYVTVACLKSK